MNYSHGSVRQARTGCLCAPCMACRKEQYRKDAERRRGKGIQVQSPGPKVDLSAAVARLREYLDAREMAE
jgi:hypothetical protein